MAGVESARVVPVVLAAGASSRMGRPKAGLELAGRTALRRILDACAEAGLGSPIVVAGADVAAVRAAAAGARATPLVVTNEEWARGRSTSLRAGLAALPALAEAFLLWPVDVPLPGADVVRSLLDAQAKDPSREAFVPSHAGRRGHPALFLRSLVPAFLALGEDAPARDVVRAAAARGAVAHVVVLDDAVLGDLDTPEDYERAAREAERRREDGSDGRTRPVSETG